MIYLPFDKIVSRLKLIKDKKMINVNGTLFQNRLTNIDIFLDKTNIK